MKSRYVIFVFCLLSLLATSSVPAQEAEVRADVSATFAALIASDVTTFAEFLHDDARGFFVYGSTMIEGFSELTLRAAFLTGLQTNVVVSDLNVRVYGNTAVSGARFEGSITLPGGAVIPGAWRYTETRVLSNGTWKIIQYHLSKVS